MKRLLSKIKENELATGIIIAAAALIIIGGLIVGLFAFIGGKNSDKSKGLVSEIKLNMKFNTSVSESSLDAGKNNSNSGVSSDAKAASSEEVRSVEVINSSPNISEYNNKKTVKKPAGTLAKVSANDRKGLAKRNFVRAQYLSDMVYYNFFDTNQMILLYDYPSKNGKVATAWEYLAFQQMQTVVASMDKTKKQISKLKTINEGLEYYAAMRKNSFWGYVVERGSYPKGAADSGLAYDDNIWIAINFIKEYEITKDKSYLKKAEYLMKFIIKDGWFEPLGGIFWDTRHEARHSCSNNPAIKPLVDLYKYTGKSYYLKWAKKIYNFSYSKLKDYELNIYEDLIRAYKDDKGNWVEGSSKNTGFYSYNTGSMISGATALYSVTKDKKYLKEALACAQGAMNYFAKANDKNGLTAFTCTSNIWFNAIWLRGLIDLYPYAKKTVAPYLEEFQKSMDYAYVTFRTDTTGFMPYDWLYGWDISDRSSYRNAIDMCANAEMYAQLAMWQKNRTD